jgi:hypothetical protein
MSNSSGTPQDALEKKNKNSAPIGRVEKESGLEMCVCAFAIRFCVRYKSIKTTHHSLVYFSKQCPLFSSVIVISL